MTGKRGRPKGGSVGVSGGLLQASVVLEAFQRSRDGGAKYEQALNDAVDASLKAFPDFKTSVTTVKIILAEFMSEKEGYESMRVTKTPGHDITGVGFKPTGTTYAIGFMPRPAYPRANRKRRDESK